MNQSKGRAVSMTRLLVAANFGTCTIILTCAFNNALPSRYYRPPVSNTFLRDDTINHFKLISSKPTQYSRDFDYLCTANTDTFDEMELAEWSQQQEVTTDSTKMNGKYTANDDTAMQHIMNVRGIMELLKQTYPEPNNTNNNDDNNAKSATQKWTKTRKYLYQYRARTSPTKKNNKSNNNKSSKTHRRTLRGPLTLQHVRQIVLFLQKTFPNHPELQAKILQNSPRILSQYHSIESRLIPTVEFLMGLYGNLPSSSGNGGAGVEGGMLYEAISRNTDLLLVRGVGYAGGGWEGPLGGEDSDGNGNSGDASDKVEGYLENELDIPASSIVKLKRNYPTLFQLSLGNKIIPVVRYLFSLLGSKYNGDGDEEEDLPKSLLENDPLSNLPKPKPKHKRQVAKILTNHPTLLFLDVKTNLEPTAQFLVDSLQLNGKELATLVATTPGVLGLSVEENLLITIKYLSEVLETGDTKITSRGGEDEGESITRLRKCIMKHPQILALSLNNLRSKVDYFDEIDNISYLEEEVDITDANGKELVGRHHPPRPSLAARILLGAPSTFSLSLKGNIVPKVEYLANLWTTPTPDNNDVNVKECVMPSGKTDNFSCSLSERLREYPQILTLSMEGNIQPTLSFFNMTGYIDLDEQGKLRKHSSGDSFSESIQQKNIIRSRYIATSLYNRLLPRWHFLLEEQRKQTMKQIENNEDDTPKYVIPTSSNLPLTDSETGKSTIPPLHLLAGASDDDFCRQLKLSLTEYLAFKEEAAPRLKFNAQFDRWLKTGRPIDT